MPPMRQADEHESVITPTAIRPETHALNCTPGEGHYVEKRTIVDEARNEVIEIPGRGYQKDSKRSRDQAKGRVDKSVGVVETESKD